MHANRSFFLFLFLLSGIIQPVNAQTGGSNSVLIFDQFFKNYSMVNPAATDSVSRFGLDLGHTALTGLFEGVNRMYANADYRPGSMNKRSFSRAGLLVLRSNDGDYINRTRVYGRYSHTIPLGKEQAVSAGIALGLVTYSFRGTRGVAGGSSSAFDGTAGLWYMRKNLKVGLSMHQITGAIVTPIQQTFRLNPYWNFNLIYSTTLSSSVRFTNHFFVRNLASRETFTSIEYVPLLTFSELIEAGVNMKFKRGIAFLLGISGLATDYGDIRFMASFLVSTRELSNSADNKFEVSAGYHF